MRTGLIEVEFDATLERLGMGKAVVRDMQSRVDHGGINRCWSGGIVDGENSGVWYADADRDCVCWIVYARRIWIVW